jgi:hypothetical protein
VSDGDEFSREVASGEWREKNGKSCERETPPPVFFVSVASTRVRFGVSPFDATFRRGLASVADKGVTGGVLGSARRRRFDKAVRHREELANWTMGKRSIVTIL